MFVSTISNGADLTLVLGVEGSVNVEGTTSLERRHESFECTGHAVHLRREGVAEERQPQSTSIDHGQTPMARRPSTVSIAIA